MIIKKFQAKTESEAVEQARKELGEGVVILSTRNKKKKGLLSIFFQPMVEITAALEDDNTNTGSPNTSSTNTPSPNTLSKGGLIPDELIAQSIPEALRDKDPIINSVSKPLYTPREGSQPSVGTTPTATAAVPTPVIPPAPAPQPAPVYQPVTPTPQGQAIEEKLDSLQNLIEQQILPLQGIDGTQAAGLAKGMAPLRPKEEPPKKDNDSFIKLLYDTMIDNEVSPENADSIIREIEGSTKQGQSIDHLLANVYQKMILKFGKSVGIRPAEKGVKVLFFIGPTGVGKTTTIAKIASRFRVEEKKNVALLTADTYRIAAAEQLATYASILDVPFRIVYTPSEMTGVLSEYMNYDYVLVDTAGHSHYNEVQKESMNQFVHSVDGLAPSEVFLVLSATTKYRDLLHIADAYRNITEYKIIFTKLDETTTLGNILNLKLYTGAEISYVTCGQNVPDDIENFNPQKTVKQLLGGKR